MDTVSPRLSAVEIDLDAERRAFLRRQAAREAAAAAHVPARYDPRSFRVGRRRPWYELEPEYIPPPDLLRHGRRERG